MPRRQRPFTIIKSVVSLSLIFASVYATAADDSSEKAGTKSSSTKSAADPAVTSGTKKGGVNRADKQGAEKTHASKAIEKAGSERSFAEQETIAIAFAEQHHPELAVLLTNLKQNNKAEFQAAITELGKTVDRLNALNGKSATAYEHELGLWKIDSRIRLLVARLTMSDNPALEAELKAAIREKLEWTLAGKRSERDRFQKRVERLDQSISELSSKLDEATEKELAAAKRSVSTSKSARSRLVKKAEDASVNKSGEVRSKNSPEKVCGASTGTVGAETKK